MWGIWVVNERRKSEINLFQDDGERMGESVEREDVSWKRFKKLVGAQNEVEDREKRKLKGKEKKMIGS